MIAYVVAGRQSDIDLLKALLPADLCQEVWFTAAGGISAVVSLASSLIAVRETPVAIAIDADSIDPSTIRERRRDVEGLIRSVSPGIPFKVIIAVPALEGILFHHLPLLRRLLTGEFPRRSSRSRKQNRTAPCMNLWRGKAR